ncbi:hypothetical protein [Nocardiopsis sp. JB363]|uniref:hypothetical protein n=1 Tax=Nocardiopsis sp. JB363 TaxID=1434837 RepID=UPI000B363CA3|nr:hypothetical protein [Nocardiopsis sp. JB363]
MEVVSEACGDREIEFCFSRFFPGNAPDPGFSEVFVEAVGEDAAGGPGEVELHARVVQGGEHVGDAGGGGEAVNHQEDVQIGAGGTPRGGEGEGSAGGGVVLGGHRSQSLPGAWVWIY